MIPGPFPDGPQSFGDHIKMKRLEEGLTHAQLGKKLGVNQWTVLNWENGNSRPRIDFYGRIVALLGFDPEQMSQSETLAEHMAEYRRMGGLSQEKAALQAGIDETTWQSWESGRKKPMPLSDARLRAFLGLPATPDPAGSFSAQLRAARLAAGLTQKEVGLILEAQATQVCAWEAGRHEPSTIRLRQLVGLFPELDAP